MLVLASVVGAVLLGGVAMASIFDADDDTEDAEDAAPKNEQNEEETNNLSLDQILGEPDGDATPVMPNEPSEPEDQIQEGGQDDDLLVGEDGHDYLSGFAANDTLIGGKGDDLLEGGAGDDKLYGGDQDDQLSGEDGDDTLDGGRGDDWLKGGAGQDQLFGAEGNDSLIGNHQQRDAPYGDLLDSGEGDDTIWAGQSDTIISGEGTDTLYITFHAGQDGYTAIEDFDAERDVIILEDDLPTDESISIEIDIVDEEGKMASVQVAGQQAILLTSPEVLDLSKIRMLRG